MSTGDDYSKIIFNGVQLSKLLVFFSPEKLVRRGSEGVEGERRRPTYDRRSH